MKWLYVIPKTICYPGTFLKALFEHITCRVLHLDLTQKPKYVSQTENSGHVLFEDTSAPDKLFLASFIPFLLTLIVGFPALATGVLTLGFLGVDVIDPLSGSFCPMFLVYCAFYYLGISLFSNLFPSVDTAKKLWKSFYGPDNEVTLPAKILAFLPNCIMVGGAYLEKFGISFLLLFLSLLYWIIF